MDVLKVSANNFVQSTSKIKKESFFFYSENNNKIACCLNNKTIKHLIESRYIIQEVKKK